MMLDGRFLKILLRLKYNGDRSQFHNAVSIKGQSCGSACVRNAEFRAMDKVQRQQNKPSVSVAGECKSLIKWSVVPARLPARTQLSGYQGSGRHSIAQEGPGAVSDTMDSVLSARVSEE